MQGASFELSTLKMISWHPLHSLRVSFNVSFKINLILEGEETLTVREVLKRQEKKHIIIFQAFDERY